QDAISVIERARSVFSLPAQLRNAAQNRDDDRFVSVFNRAQGLAKETEVSIYQDVLKDCNITAQKFSDELFDTISLLSLTRNQYDRCLTTLFELKQFPVIVLRDNPVIFLLRTHRDILRKEYEIAFDKLTTKKYEKKQDKVVMQSMNVLAMTSSKHSVNTRSSTLSTGQTTQGKNDANHMILKSKKYQTVTVFCDKMLEHMPKLIGVVQFSTVKKKEDEDNNSTQLRKTSVIFEDGSVVSVSYSKTTTASIFLDLAVSTYKLSKPDMKDDVEYELCSFIGKTNEKNQEVLSSALKEAIVIGESDFPYELETIWMTAAKEVSHGFFAREKQGDADKVSSSDRSAYVVKIVEDFCENMSKVFKYEDKTNTDLEHANAENLVEKSCLEAIENVLVGFKAQQVEEKYIEPLRKAHGELVSSFIERITEHTRARIIAMKDTDEVFLNPGNGILVGFQRIYTEDFKMLKEIIQATENPDEQVIQFFGISVKALKEFFEIASKECVDSLLARKKRENESFEEGINEISEYSQLTKQRKLLSLTENSQNALSGQSLWDLYTFSSTKKDLVVEGNLKVKEVLKEFEEISKKILEDYIDDRSVYFNDMMNRIDAKYYETWIVEDIDFKGVDEYALNIVTELIVVKQDLHVFAMSKESSCMSKILLNLIKSFREVTKKTMNEMKDKHIQDKEATMVCIRWMMGAMFLIKACKPLIEKNTADNKEIQSVMDEIKELIGKTAEDLEPKMKETVDKTMTTFAALVDAFKLTAAVDEEKSQRITKSSRPIVGKEKQSISFLDTPMEDN
ncbi:hypothetical protein EIN_169820, partial [Entamoeba invadens IP1]